MLKFNFGTRADDATQSITYPEEAFHEHMVVFGKTGMGKSKLIEGLLRELLRNDRGFCLIDPHGDLAEDILAYIDHHRPELPPDILDRVIYLEPAHPDWCFAYDLFEYRGPMDQHAEWLETRIHQVMRILAKDQTNAPRLERILPLVLAGVGVPVNDEGTHLSLADAMVLLNPRTDLFQKIYPLILPRVAAWNRDAAMQLQNLVADSRRFGEMTESTLNRLTRFLFRRVKDICSGPRPSIDFRNVVRKRAIVIANLHPSDNSFTEDHANAFGGFLIHEILRSVADCPREERRRYFMFVDEAHRFLSEDLGKAFQESRKHMLSVCLATQEFSSLKYDKPQQYAPLATASNQAGMTLVFRENNEEDCEKLGKIMTLKGFDRTRKIVEVDRQDGWEKQTVHGRSKSDSQSNGYHEGGSEMEQFSMPATANGPIQRRAGTANTSGASGASGHSESESEQEVLLPKYRTETRDDGLQYSHHEQVAERSADIAQLAARQAILQVANHAPIEIVTPNVPLPHPPYTDSFKRKVLERIKDSVCQRHPSFFRRREVVIDDEERIQRFVEAASRSPVTSVLAIKNVTQSVEPAYLDATEQPDCPISF